MLALNTREQMLTWQCVLVAYCQLEALALELLRLHQGKDKQTFWNNPPTWSLNQVAKELRQYHLVEEIIPILKNVADLRNSVAHKQLLSGMTSYAQYNDTLVFDSQYIEKFLGQPDIQVSGVNEETVEQLLKDVEQARAALVAAILHRS